MPKFRKKLIVIEAEQYVGKAITDAVNEQGQVLLAVCPDCQSLMTRSITYDANGNKIVVWRCNCEVETPAGCVADTLLFHIASLREYHFNDGFSSPLEPLLQEAFEQDAQATYQVLSDALAGVAEQWLYPDLFFETLNRMMWIDHKESLDLRFELAVQAISHTDATVRDGGAIALEYATSHEYAEALEKAAGTEPIEELKEYMLAVASNIRSNEHCQPHASTN